MNFGPSAADYARHRVGFPAAFFEAVPLGGRLLDLGAGTGALARGYAARGAQVVALDLSGQMLREAADLPARVVARAEAAPLRAGTFDAVTAGQCWHWFDGPRVAAECRRLLRPSGQLIIAHFNYLPLPGSVAAASEALILERSPGWPLAGVHRMRGVWDEQLRAAGFVDLRTLAFEVEQPYTREAWRGRMRACNGVLAMPDAQREDFERAHEALLAERFPEAFTVPHEVFALLSRPQ